MVVPLLVLVLQIGFNVALNNRNINPRFTSPRFVNSGKTRRFFDSDSSLPWSSRGIPNSDSEQSDSVYSSLEENDFRAARALRSRTFNDLTDKNHPDYDVSSGFGSSVGRACHNNCSNNLQSSSSIPHQSYPNHRRPHVLRPSNRPQGLSLKKYKKSEHYSNEDYLPGEEDHILIFDRNRKYYNYEDELSVEDSPFDKWNSEEDVDNSLPSIPHRRRNNRKQNKYLRLRQPSTAKNILGAYDTILLVTDDDTSDEAINTKPKLRPSSLEESIKKEDSRRYSNHKKILRLSLSPDYVTLDEGPASHLSKLLSKTLKAFNLVPVYLRTQPPNRHYHREDNNMHSAEDNKGSNLFVLKLGSLEIPNTESLLRGNPDSTIRNSDVNLRRSRNDIEYLKQLLKHDNLKNPVSYDKSKNRRNVQQYRNEDFPDEFSLDTLFDFDKEDDGDDVDSLELTNKLSALRSTKEPSKSSNENPWKKEFLFNDHLNLNKTKNSSDVTSLRELNLQLRKMPKETKNTNGSLHLEFPWNNLLSSDGDKNNSNKSALCNLDSQLKSQEKNNNTSALLHLEFPWNDQLSPNGDKNNNSVSDLHDPDSQFRSQTKINKTNITNDSPYLDFPWNDQLSPDSDKHSNNLSALRDLDPQLKNQEKIICAHNTTDLLHLDFPDQLSLDGDKHSNNLSALRGLDSQLKNQEKINKTNNTTDLLHLEFPWNDQLSPDDDKNSKQSIFSGHTSKTQLANPEIKDDTDQQRPNENKSVRLQSQPKNEVKLKSPDKWQKINLRTPDPFYIHPYLWSRNIQTHPNDLTRRYSDVERVGLIEIPNNKVTPSSSRRLNKKQSLRVKSTSIESMEKDTDKVIDSEEIFPFPLDRRPQRVRSLPDILTFPPTTTKAGLTLKSRC